MQERLELDSKHLGDLEVGQEVAIQDPPAGGKAGRWVKSGTVVEKLPHDAYQVRVHGSRALTKRNRCYLRKIIPFIPEERLIPVSCPAARSVPEETVLESAERFVAVQPPRAWQRMSPAPHRKASAGSPGEDIISRLKAREAEGAAR